MSKSLLWKKIIKDYAEKNNLEDFRQPGNLNSRLAHWNPRELSLRWFKSFLLSNATKLNEEEINIYKNFGCTNVGKPINVTINDSYMNEIEVNLDYLLALHEILFLNKNLEELTNIRTICEIGAGFGRTCHALLSTFNSIEFYTIYDLPEMLELSRLYLRKVLSESLFSKILFVEVGTLQNLQDMYDLTIQIDGLQEIDAKITNNYYEKIFKKSSFFFSVNPIGKFLPEIAGIEKIDNETLKIVLSLGRSLDVLDIWNLKEIKNVRNKHIKNYAPDNSSVIFSESHPLFPHYEMSLYRNSY